MPPSLIERAFEVAESGRCDSLRDLRRLLKAERYANIDWTLQGAGLRKQLKGMIEASRARRDIATRMDQPAA